MEVLGIVVHWIHVLAAIVWFGGALYFDLVVLPSVADLSPSAQQRFGTGLTARSKRVFSSAAGIVMLVGIIRGTLVGPIKSLDVLLGSAYGITWLLALLLTIGLAFMGARLIGGLSERLYADDSLWTGAEGSPPPAALLEGVARLKRLSMIELGGFLVVFTLMILMRFGY